MKNVDPNGIGDIMIIVTNRNKDGSLMKIYQVHRLVIDRSRFEIKRRE